MITLYPSEVSISNSKHIMKQTTRISYWQNVVIQVAQLSQRDRAARWSVSAKSGRQYSPDNISLSSTTMT